VEGHQRGTVDEVLIAVWIEGQLDDHSVPDGAHPAEDSSRSGLSPGPHRLI
jgi:hypothetical protein